MPKAYYRFHLTNLGEFFPFQGLKNSVEISVPVSEVTFLTHLIKLLETKSVQSLEESNRKYNYLFVTSNFTKLLS